MKIIVGLGNPGKEYEKTRHNIGFMVVDKLAEIMDININKNKFNGLVGEGMHNGEKILIIKPQTFMNLSGNCVQEAASFYKVNSEDILVIYDDIDIEFGKIRIRPNGSPGTHNGMRNITERLQTQNFPRIRVGAGRPKGEQQLYEFVLSEFNKDEMKIMQNSIENSANAVIEILKNGLLKAMNEFN
ncbi:MAG: aminoacyl-tRNA hydrolase [Clostridia bacterium]|nr:aminoacyl-tRNA hydrolase [Clostridia bacterium]